MLILLVLLIVSLGFSSTQTFVAKLGADWLSYKTGKQITISYINIGILSGIDIKNIYVEDANKDTLLFAADISVDINLLSSAFGDIAPSSVDLEDVVVKIKVDKDSIFNFNYLIDAFVDKTEQTNEVSNNDINLDLNNVFVELENTRFIFYSELDELKFSVNSGNLNLITDSLDIANFYFSTKDINISNVRVDLDMLKEETNISEELTVMKPIYIAATKTNFENISFYLNFAPEKLKLFAEAKSGYITPKTIDIFNGKYFAKDAEVIGAKVDIEFYGDNIANLVIDSSLNELIELVPDVGVEAGSDRISMIDSEFSLNYTNEPINSKMFDINHLKYIKLNVLAENAEYLKGEMHADIKSMSGLIPNTNMKIKDLKTKVVITNNGMDFSSLKMKTANSYLSGNYTVNYNKFNDILGVTPSFNKLFVDMDTAKIDIAEVNYFYNTDSLLNLTKINKKQISISTYITGNTTKLNVDKLNLGLFDNSQISTAGTIENINNFDSLKYNFELKTLKLTKTEIGTVLQDSLPNYFNYILAKGEFNGGVKDIDTKLNLFTDLGEFNLDLSLQDSSYNANLVLLKQNYNAVFEDSIYLEDLYAHVKIIGEGFNYETNTMNVELQIDSVNFEKEKLTDLNIKLDAKEGYYKTIIHSTNEKINLYSDIDFYVKDSVYEFVAKSNIKNLDLQYLGFVDKKALINLNVDATYKAKGFDVIKANVVLSNLYLFYDREYKLNALNTNIDINDSLTNIDLTSDYISGFVRSNFNVKETKKYFLSFIDDYFNKNDTSIKYKSKISFAFDINDENLIRENLVPGLKTINTSKVVGDFNSENYSFNFNAKILDFNYNEVIGDTISVDFKTKNEQIDYHIDFNKVNLTDSFFVDDLSLVGVINRDSLTLEFIDNELEYKKYYFGAAYTIKDSISRIRIYPEIVFDSLVFDVNKDNYIDFGKDYLKFGEISILNKEQKIYVKPSEKNGDIDLLIENLDLNLLSKNNFFQDNLVSGKFNANAKINLEGDGSIFAEINDLKFYDGDIGRFEFNTKLEKWKYTINSTIKGQNADIVFSGGNKPSFNIDTKVNKFDLLILENAIDNVFDSLSGFITGDFNLKNIDKLDFNGYIDFDNIKFKSRIRSASLNIDKQKLEFSNNLIKFNNFTISDKEGNVFYMNGKLYDIDFDYFKADLNLVANNFSLLDATKDQNERFYGKILIDNKSKIIGDINNLEITSEIRFLKGTKITYVYPEAEMMSIEKPDGVVEFIVQQEDSLLFRDTVVDNWLSNMIIKSNIYVDENTEVNIIFNDVAGENISVVGGGNINLDIDKGGNINLFGQYKIKKGYYDLSYYELVKRKFDLKEGSRILWTGDPYNPTADIIASYKLRTNPYPLMATSGLTDVEMAKYKLNQIFKVNLSIKGMMMYPEMSFTIEYPRMTQNSNDQALHSKINMINSDPNKANKQAISLLVMSSFVTDDGNTVNGGETFVNNSVSGLLTSQLNKYSSKFIKGVDFDFDINRFSTYNSGTSDDGSQTDVKIKMKKSLFNDRVVVEVAGGVSMENSSNSNSGNNSIHDAAIEYLITKDGRYKLRVFSEKDYSTLNNDVQSSGLSVVYTTEFDDITDMFKRESVAIKEEEE